MSRRKRSGKGRTGKAISRRRGKVGKGRSNSTGGITRVEGGKSTAKASHNSRKESLDAYQRRILKEGKELLRRLRANIWHAHYLRTTWVEECRRWVEYIRRERLDL